MENSGGNKIIYSFVARGTTVLAEYTSYSGNFSQLAVEALEKSNTQQERFTYTCDGYTFNFLKRKIFTFLAVADDEVGREVAFGFLEKVAEDFEQRIGQKASDAIAHSLDREYGPRLRSLMEYYSHHPEEASRVSKVQKQVDEVKGVMMDNIEKVLDRGEKIDLLVDKTSNLRFQADTFQRTGRQLRRRMWWQNLRMKLIVAAGVIILFLFLFLVICLGGSGGSRCW